LAAANWSCVSRPVFSFPKIATGDLNVPIIAQLPAANLSLGNEFEPRPVEMIGFETAFGRRGLWKQYLEDAPGNPHHAFVFADTDAELDNRALGVPAGIRRKTKEHVPPEMFIYCSG